MGACSSRPKTAEFEGNMNFYVQEEVARKNVDDDQESGCDAGSKCMDPETAEIAKSMNLYLQEEMARESLEDDQKSGSNADLKSIGPEQIKTSSQCSLLTIKPGNMENEHRGKGVLLLESEKEHLAGSSQETRARAEGNHDAKHNSVAEEESGVPEIGTDIVELQNKKKSVVQELYEEPAFTQKEDVLGSCENSSLFEEEPVVELPQKVALRDAENGKFRTLEKIDEEKELPSFEERKPRIDAQAEGIPASAKAIQEPLFLARRVSDVDFKLKISPAGSLKNCRTENAAAFSATRAAANGSMLLQNETSGGLFLEEPSNPEGLVYEAQGHNLKKALKEQSAPLTQDSEWTNLNLTVTPSNRSLTVKENAVAYVIPPALIGLPEATALSNGSLSFVGIKVDEFSCIDISPSVLKSTGKGGDKKVKEAHMPISCQSSKFSEVCAKCSCSADENLGVHETEKPLMGLVNIKAEDDLMAWNLGNEALDMIPSKDGNQVDLKKGRKVNFFVADINESITREALDSPTSSLFEVRKEPKCPIQERNMQASKSMISSSARVISSFAHMK